MIEQKAEATDIEIIFKPWGFEKLLSEEPVCGKILHIIKGKHTSMHWHSRKNETLYVQSGKIQLLTVKSSYSSEPGCADSRELKDMFQSMKEENIKFMGNFAHSSFTAGDCIKIPAGAIHQIYAIQESQIFECSDSNDKNDTFKPRES